MRFLVYRLQNTTYNDFPILFFAESEGHMFSMVDEFLLVQKVFLLVMQTTFVFFQSFISLRLLFFRFRKIYELCLVLSNDIEIKTEAIIRVPSKLKPGFHNLENLFYTVLFSFHLTQ